MKCKLIFSTLTLAAAWPCLAQNPARIHQVGASVQRTLRPARLSAVSVDSLPNAVCTLQGQDDKGVVHSLKLYADDQGQVRFHAGTPSASDNPAKLDLQCELDDQVMHHSIELRSNAAAVQTDTAETRLAERARRPGRVRPALSGDPLQPSQDELVSRGYPVRPDPEQAPEAYATWLRAVSTEANVIEARTVLQPDRSHGPTSPIRVSNLPSTRTSNNWSGFAVYQDPKLSDFIPPKPYDWVSAEWYIPSVTGELFIQDDSAFWVGLDGLTSNDVLQDGTEQQAMNISIFGAQWTIATYYAWVEFFPLSEQRLTNFQVNPGDHMLGQVWPGNAGSKPTLNGIFGVCLLYNLTTNTSTTVYIPIPAGVTFSGTSAEWIMERPTVNGVLPDLSNYGAAFMWSAYAKRSDGTVVTSNGNLYGTTITMVNNGKSLSTVYRLNDTSMLFSWLAFK